MLRSPFRYNSGFPALRYAIVVGTAVLGISLASDSAIARGRHSKTKTTVLRLQIVGTDVEFDEFGLPKKLSGVMYFAGGKLDGRFAGYYSEELTPILDPEFGLIGTTGTAEFTFAPFRHRKAVIGSLTTEDESWIVGVDPETGAILVESTGIVTKGRGIFRGAEGGFKSSSTLILGDVFVLDTDLEIRLTSETSKWFKRRRKHKRRR